VFGDREENGIFYSCGKTGMSPLPLERVVERRLVPGKPGRLGGPGGVRGGHLRQGECR